MVKGLADLRELDERSQQFIPKPEKTWTVPSFDLPYYISPSNWYKTFPFGFELKVDQELYYRFFLPIPPQNYTIQDMSTSEAHATIGGVVEEINKPVFSMITLVGTTGLSINMPNLGTGDQEPLNFTFQQRKTFEDLTQTQNPVAKLLSATINGALNFIEPEQALPYQNSPSAVNTPESSGENGTVKTLFENAETTPAKDLLERTVAFATTAKIPKNEFTNGWAWSQALRQFFLIFQRERAKNSSLELYFCDFKSRTRYRCIPRSVQFQQNANAPYLINYTIILKCWDINDANNEQLQIKAIDRFQSDLKEVNTTTLTGVISKVGNVCKTLNRFDSVAGSYVRNSVGSFL